MHLIPFAILSTLLVLLNSAFCYGADFSLAGKGVYALAALIDVTRSRGIGISL